MNMPIYIVHIIQESSEAVLQVWLYETAREALFCNSSCSDWYCGVCRDVSLSLQVGAVALTSQFRFVSLIYRVIWLMSSLLCNCSSHWCYRHVYCMPLSDVTNCTPIGAIVFQCLVGERGVPMIKHCVWSAGGYSYYRCSARPHAVLRAWDLTLQSMRVL